MRNHLVIFLMMLFVFVSCEREDPNGGTLPELFTRTSTAVYESPLDLAADPSIVKMGDSLVMYYTAENYIIGVVVSDDDGETWKSPDGDNSADYAALKASENSWDQTLETVDVIQVGNEFWMYYSGYIEGNDDNDGIISNYEIGLAISTNGIDFTRHPESIDQAIISRDVSSFDTDDRHAMTSPGVVFENGDFYMIYAGWNVHKGWTGDNAGIRILGATSSDGVNWTKLGDPLILPVDVTFNPDINEASLLKSEDGYWYIPFSTGSSIGIARSTSFLGPYDIYPGEIISPETAWSTEVTAPDGIISDGKMRLWFHGVKEPAFWPWVIGYGEAAHPLKW